MKKALIINSSTREAGSHSRKLTEIFTGQLKESYPDMLIKHRELGNADVPHITDNWITAAHKHQAARSDQEISILKISDTYVDEILEADLIVIGSPMYNWSVPSSLKAYIDQILRINRTWKFNPDKPENPYTGLLENKKLFLLLSRGAKGYEKGEYNEHMNFQSTYLKTVFNIMGIESIHVIAVNGTNMNQDDLKISIQEAHRKIKEVIDTELALAEQNII